eukprot:CAMPEP_0194276978 /NCGR_PEP_ID=MMETSP0169-20130528/9423_1 /TAXON_ID=218684 /ORGANISM="Corethron pennatum, Strain L29A3" /LENGTH=196 /DNA_ID=CAMNT_0039020825 /DNA_START=132 /DNA_END=722 /DNA_ORIENTATION=+
MYTTAIAQICFVFFGAVSVRGKCLIEPTDGVVRIPDGTKSIDKNAFGFCDALIAVIIPTSVTHVQTNAFGSAKNLEIVFFQKRSDLEVINQAFVEGSHIGKKKSSELVVISYGAFFNCPKLKTINIPSKATIGLHAFHNTGCAEGAIIVNGNPDYFTPGAIIVNCEVGSVRQDVDCLSENEDDGWSTRSLRKKGGD